MKCKILTALALVALAGAVQGAPERIEVTSPTPRSVTRDEVAAVRGYYDLSDGRTLNVRSDGRRLIADLGDLPQTDLLALTPTRMISTDGRLALSFQAAPSGRVYGVVVTIYPTTQ